MRFVPILVMVLVGFVVGCGQDKKKEPVALDQIPENVMKVAKEKLPDVRFERAVKKPNGEFEIIGKNKEGKVREIDITPAGEVTEIE
jgi:hypothetical protein